MALPLPWLLRWAALCHLTALLAGQHHGVDLCRISCNTMTSKIPLERLIGYHQRNQASCGKPAIILKTIRNKIFCADPKAEWVRQAMEYLDRKTATTVADSGTLGRRIGEPRITPDVVSESKTTGESQSQEAPPSVGTSPELPTGTAGYSGTGFPTGSKVPDGGPSTGPERTELFNTAGVTSDPSWQSSSAYQPGPDIRDEGKASEVPSTQAAPTQAPSTQTPPTQAPSTQAPSTQTLPTQAPSTQTLPTQAPSTQAPHTQAPSTQTLPTQAPSTQAPAIPHSAPVDHVGSEGQTLRTSGQDTTPRFKETDALSALTEAVVGSGSLPHVSVVPSSSEGAPAGEPVTFTSWTPKAEEPIHATMDRQRLNLLTTPVPDPQAATRRQAVGLLAFLGLLFCLGVAMFAYQSLQGCPRNMVGDMVEGIRYVPRSCGSNSYVLVPV